MNENLIKLGNLIKNARENAGYTHRELAKIANVKSPGEISQIENGNRKNPSAITVKKIAKALKLDYFKLFSLIDYIDSDDLKPKDQSNISISKLKSGSVEMIQVPVYNSVSAGSGLEPTPEPVDVLLLPKSVAEGCVIINVWGNSMEPTIKDGYAVMVKREVEVANNDIGIFIHEGEALVKRYKCFDGKCYLYSDNQNYPPREIRKDDEFKVCGKVIWIMEKA